jgi:hypothetical protein
MTRSPVTGRSGCATRWRSQARRLGISQEDVVDDRFTTAQDVADAARFLPSCANNGLEWQAIVLGHGRGIG